MVYSGKTVVIGQKLYYSGISGYIRALWLYLKTLVIFGRGG